MRRIPSSRRPFEGHASAGCDWCVEDSRGSRDTADYGGSVVLPGVDCAHFCIVYGPGYCFWGSQIFNLLASVHELVCAQLVVGHRTHVLLNPG
jgi:hypothetical protein